MSSMRQPSKKDKRVYAKYLGPDEEMTYVTSISPKYFRSMFLSWLILAPTIIGLVNLARIIRKRATVRYIFTTRRVLIKEGFLAVTVMSAPFDKITHLSVKQTMLERLAFNDGHIIIHTAGPTPIEMVIEHVESPFELKNTLESLIDQERLLSSTPPLPLEKEDKPKHQLIRPFI